MSLLQLMSQYSIHYYQLKSTLFRFPKFLPIIFFLFQDPIQDRTWHLVIPSPQAPPGCDGLSDSLCFRWPWQFWGVLVRDFVECPSVGIHLIFFSWLDWGFGFLGGRSQRENALLLTSCQGFMLSVWLISVDVTWSPGWGVFARCLHLLSPHFHPVLFGRKSLCPPHI